jgi:hypothetical protein
MAGFERVLVRRRVMANNMVLKSNDSPGGVRLLETDC